MKLSSLLVAACLTLSASAASATTLDVRGTTYTVDTVYHAKIGPGTTQTHLHLIGTNPLHVYYLTIDTSVPGVSMRTVCATDKVAGCQRTSNMAKEKTKDGVTYFCGTNGDFYATTGTATNGKSIVGTPASSCIVDGEIYKSANNNYQFVQDTEGKFYISRLNYFTGTATIGDKVTLFKGVNYCKPNNGDVNVASPNNGITIYTPRFWGSANQTEFAGSCYQVTAKLVEGEQFKAGHTYKMIVTSEPNTTGDTAVPDDGFVISGRGTSTTGCNTSAADFVKDLKIGDIVTFDNRILTSDGTQIYPQTVMSGNPRNVGEGETLDTEGERGDASGRHPRTSIGYAKDGKTVIMMVIDGRSSISAGVSTSMTADVMRYAGAYEAVNIDGGGSSTLYVDQLGVRNHTSDGQERSVGNAIFAVLEAPEDNNVAEIAFVDWRKDVPYLSVYTPTVYAFNKYGKLIDADYKGYTLSCPAELGYISADGKSLIASGSGYHALTATVEGTDAKVSIPVTVVSGYDITAKYDAVLLNSVREWSVELVSGEEDNQFPILASALTWTSSDPSVAEITPEGDVKGIANGSTELIGVRGDLTVKINLTIEIPMYEAQKATDFANYTLTKTGMNSADITELENGMAIDFNIKTIRSNKLTITAKKPLYSLAEALRLRFNPGETPIKSIVVNLRANNEVRSVSITRTDVSASADNVYEYKFAELFNTDDIGVYPIELTSIVITPENSKASAGTDYHIDMPGIESLYDPSTLSVGDITADDNATDAFYTLNGSTITVVNGASDIMLTDQAGRTVKHAVGGAINLSGMAPGIYVLSASVDGTLKSAKIAIR